MKRAQLSRSAGADLEEIDDYTIEHFGLEQAVRTTDAFRRAFAKLADFPLSGKLDLRHSLDGRPFRFWTVLSSFVIVYEPTDAGIRVARVLHGARHLLAELERDAGEAGG